MRIEISKRAAAVAVAAVTAIVSSPVAALAASPGNGTAPQAGATPSTVGTFAAAPFRMQNQKSSKLLQPLGEGQLAGTRVVQERDAGTGFQRWTIVNDGDYISLENYSARLNMTVDGSSTAAGKSAVLASGSGDTSQDWKVLWKDSTHTWFRLQNRRSSKCLGISGASTADHAVAAQFGCDTSTNQTWKFF